MPNLGRVADGTSQILVERADKAFRFPGADETRSTGTT
jgi:hypothetical protein